MRTRRVLMDVDLDTFVALETAARSEDREVRHQAARILREALRAEAANTRCDCPQTAAAEKANAEAVA